MSWTLVTGGAKRLGAEICRQLAGEGCDLLIHYRNSEAEAQQVAEQCRQSGVRVQLLQGSFDSAESINAFLERYASLWPDLQHLVLNAAHCVPDSILAIESAMWSHLFQVNVHSVQQLCRHLAPSLTANRGSVTALGVSGMQRARPHDAAYCASINARWGVIQSLALELAPQGARANMVSPGQLENSIDYQPGSHAHLPMGRPGFASEVAQVVCWLVREQSAYITGQNIEVAGGNRL